MTMRQWQILKAWDDCPPMSAAQAIEHVMKKCNCTAGELAGAIATRRKKQLAPSAPK